MKKESIEGPTKLKNKKSGLIYLLIPKPKKEGYYLSANDGMVPSGQMIYWTEEEIWSVFERV